MHIPQLTATAQVISFNLSIPYIFVKIQHQGKWGGWDFSIVLFAEMPYNAYMLKSETQELIRKLAVKYNLKTVIVFGSVAREKALDNSDIDLAILADRDFYEEKFADFNYDLMEAEEIEKAEIEVVPISDRNPILLFNIFNDGIPIYIKDREEYWRLRSWARFSYEENSRFFGGRKRLLEKRLRRLMK